MPAYNVQNYIAESIESVIAQTYKNWELIIVDDGSTDDTEAIVKKYQLTEDRIKYFYQENLGQSSARNAAIKNSTGEYIAFLDADDLWLPQKLEISVKEIKAGNYDLLFTGSYFFNDGSDKDISYLKLYDIEASVYQGRSGVLAFLERNRIPNLTVLIKKNILIAAGDYKNYIVAEDYEMWLRLLHQGAMFKSISTPLSLYRVRNDSLTANDRSATFETMVIMRSFAQQHIEYRKDVSKILKTKFKHWLYNGYQVTNKKYRAVILGIYPYIITSPLCLLSFLVPFTLLRKLTNRSL